ncbi:MAG: hypothetical protein ACE3L7_16860 [Candidatus Pristimantibacillus sp.]
MEIYEKLVAVNDSWVEDGLNKQVLDSNSEYYGGVTDPENGIAWPSHGGTPMVMAILAAALINKDSIYYHDAELLSRLELGAEYMLRFQHEDGTISPGWTNLHSPPDTGFVVVGLAQVYELLVAQRWEPLQKSTTAIRLFLDRTIPALITGGCHTPNHRWVMTAALGFMYKLTGKPVLLERGQQWLAEGMDCTEDGEWTERSNGIYNAVSDVMLYHASKLFDRVDLLEPVRRNLRMMSYLVHPNGEVVTDYSGRQDFGQSYDMASYLLVSKLMACEDHDPLFAAIAELAGQATTHPGMLPNNAMVGYLLYPQLSEHLVEAGELPQSYRVIINREFPREHYLSDMETAGHGGRIYHSRLHPDFGAPVARQREGDTSVTAMTETNSFFALRHGAARLLAVQIATSFEPGFIKMEHMEVLDDGYLLSGSESKGYYSPVPTDQLPITASGAISPWYLLPHHLREITHEQHHSVQVKLTEQADGWKIHLIGQEPERMMAQVTFVFGGEGAFSGAALAPAMAEAQFWTEGTIRYESGNDWMELDGGAQQHLAKEIRNTSYAKGCQTLVVNLMTPYDREFNIRLSPNK